MKKILLLLLIFVSGCTGVVAQQFDYGKIAPHPRLLLPAGGEEAIRKAIAEYPPLATVHQRIMELCDRTLTEPPVERIKEGKRLLAISRIALKRIYYLSYAYRMTGDKKYAHRAEQEMLARGIVVTELSSEEKQKFRAAVQPLYDQFADQSELIARIQNS